MYYDPGTGQHVLIDGMVVERDALRVVEAINDYDPNLYVLCVDPQRAEGISEEPFVVVEKCSDGTCRPVMRAWTLDDTLLERIRLSDTHRGNILQTLADMEKKEADKKQERYKDRLGEASDISASIMRMKGSNYSVRDPRTGELITFFDDKPAKRD